MFYFWKNKNALCKYWLALPFGNYLHSQIFLFVFDKEIGEVSLQRKEQGVMAVQAHLSF